MWYTKWRYVLPAFADMTILMACTAIDMWSAGIIFLFFLTKKFPIFQSTDDTEALMEIAAIIGKKRMEKTATLHSEAILCCMMALFLWHA